MRLRFLLPFAAVFCLPVSVSRGGEIEFNRDIRPILSDYCFACHGPSSAARKADLRLDQRESAEVAGVLSGGKPEESELVRRVFSTDPAEIMPPPESKKELTDAQKDLLKRWISGGAEYQAHWAFIPVPKSVAVPKPVDANHWIKSPIDAFVFDRLDREKLQAAEPAAREQWLRRVSFDLTGLPPTIPELDAFLADKGDEAFDKVVTRLLQSPAYGERMANDWLDAARYADTFGYQADRDMHMWPWRDWVIRAFQSNLSYRDFIVWQLAGDMLENPTRDQKLATAFNRLHRQTNEGGSIEEEFRIEYVADRLRTSGSAFLGLTFECARCHDHKYDPISQRDYYSLTAFFNNIDEHGLYSHFTETAPTPVLLLYKDDQEARHIELKKQIQEKEAELAKAREKVVVPESLSSSLELPAADAVFNFDDLQPSGDYKPVEGKNGKAIEFGGDDAYVCQKAGQFSRTSSFTLAMWLKPGPHQARQIIAHRCQAAEDAAFRGYALTLDNGVPVFSLIHFWPGNAIRVRAEQNLRAGEWAHVAVTYDGGSHASSVRLFVNGREMPVAVERDGLTRDFTYRPEWGDSAGADLPLALGARFRDVGFKGGLIDDLEVFARPLTVRQIATLAGVETPNDPAALREDACLTDAGVQAIQKDLQSLRVQENELIGQVQQIMAMSEMQERRPTYVLARGAYDARTDRVDPNVPNGIFAMPAEYPKNRLGFAQWTVDERNPLTARVAVNRFWMLLFGRGLVSTTQDFGSQGQTPSHPELLDWLARDFMDHNWDVQRLLRMIVLSSTYRQSSTPHDPATYRTDPDNRLLAHGPRHRLAAEQVRDAALLVSGLLKTQVGGDSVFPYQPAGLWEEAGTGKSYSQSHGDGLYRRSLYSFWRRTSPPPTMTTFDAPTREYCVVQRERTATPLQSLALLNDPQFIEAARVLAEKFLTAESDSGQRLKLAFRMLISREPTDTELAVLTGLIDKERSEFREKLDDAAQYLSIGESPRNTTLDVAEHAALTAVIQAIMNYDEFMSKR
jgi:hypothetical protein